ncbi:hypothetical protein [Actinoplanes teichomyceticus]|uniref:Peptidase metallopeptidase domain-containing protein n=1 Tax=Actinoplanes teichomyceticus TaxID=1867 RepID=A0A561WKS0_ACTTI|nr:hypothetical protein [Actinoplanes teichomyceticus]TWG24461.1 hypothetical protein FHX34_1021017 [Actinoplanes teichomyceticus]GIF12688.1 hypothetical protein Ate01nite_27200 [Actinoplanes teichomyceticus]
MSFICVDRVPGVALQDRLDRRAGHAEEAAGLSGHFWTAGGDLRVRFLDGPRDLRERVMAAAADWTAGTALSFTVVTSGGADIRVTFAGAGNWSALGTLSRETEMFPAGAPTMCLGEAPGAAPARIAQLARHEFGHAIGLIHEHSSPSAGIRWNRPHVLAALAGPPNFWTPQEVADNVFARYRSEQTQFTAFDPDSVMLYAFPPSWTLDAMTFPENIELSAQDRAFVRGIYR